MSSSLGPVIELELDGTTLTARKGRVRKTKTEETETAEDTSTGKKRNWTKYAKKYKVQWEQEPVFADWLHRTPENLIEIGKPEAYCIFCQQCLRAHKSDLLDHAKSKKHKDAANAPRAADCRSYIESYVPDVEDESIDGQAFKASDPPTKRTRGKMQKPIANNVAIIEQINAEFEDTLEKIKVCREELDGLEVKKARLEFELDYYINN